MCGRNQYVLKAVRSFLTENSVCYQALEDWIKITLNLS